MKKNAISIYVSSMGYYNEGIITGDWLNLPVSDEELHKYLIEKVKMDQRHEEIFITDYEAPFKIDQFEDIHTLNNLAKLADDMDDDEVEMVYMYCDNLEISDACEVINVLLQADELPIESFETCQYMSDEEALGWHIMEIYNPEIIKILEDNGMIDCFDYERYAEQFDYDIIGDGLFVRNDMPVKTDLYSLEEIEDMVA